MGTQALMEQRCFNDLPVIYIGCCTRNFFDNDKDQKTKCIATITKGTRD